MLQNIKVTNYLGEELTISMINPEQSGFFIKKVEGIGPTKANINLIDVVSIDGSLFNNARMEKRNIVLTLGAYDITTDVETIRQLSYRMFPPKRKLRLDLESDNMKVYTYGYVESNEPDIWSKQVTMKISIICPQPFFYNLYENSITFNGDSEEHIVVYDGDSETGLKFIFNCGADTKGLKILNKKGEYFAIKDDYLDKIVEGGFISGDVITINTMVNEKSMTLTRTSEEGEVTEYNILNALDRSSKWFKIGKGNNTFTVEATEGLEDMYVTITSPILYDGV